MTADAVAVRFGIRVASVVRLGGGHINETFLVRGTPNDCIVQRVNTDVFTDPDAITRNVVTLHNHLQSELTPEPLAASNGDWLLRDAGEVWRAWRVVDDAEPASSPTAAQASSAAGLLGRFHSRVADLEPGRLSITIPNFHDARRRLDALRAAIVDDPCGRVARASGEIDAAFASSHLASHASELSRALPSRVTHNDCKLDNFLFRGPQAVCLVDLDTLMPGAWLWDIGDLVRTGATATAEDDHRATIDHTRYTSIVSAYRDAVAGVATASELEAIDVAGAIVTYEQAVRFLTDWLMGDVYYRTADELQNLDRARSQFSVLASMPGTVAPR